jgi:hypothetical protein
MVGANIDGLMSSGDMRTYRGKNLPSSSGLKGDEHPRMQQRVVATSVCCGSSSCPSVSKVIWCVTLLLQWVLLR